jgi:hypothetical protein
MAEAPAFEDVFAAHLRADATIVGLVGERIYPTVRPQGSSVPALVYLVAEQPVRSLAGHTSKLTRVDCEVSCFARTNADARENARAVKSRLDDAVVSSMRIGLIQQLSLYDNETKQHFVQMDFLGWLEAD